jgi:regulation of enolase protein 1 (concanavalin A-like superfamily)
MKPNYLSLFVLLISILACGFPSSTPATPTFNPLPPTPNLPFSAGPVPQASIAPAVSSFRDDFDGALDPRWTWLREDPSAWSLVVTPGWLHINLSTSGYLSSLPSNVLTLPAPQGDFDLRTKIRFSPKSNFEFSGLVIIFDQKMVLQAGRAFCDVGTCVGNGFYFDNLQNGVTVGGNFGKPGNTDDSLVRIVRQGNIYTAYYQVDFVNWMQLGSHTVDSQPISVGLIAAQAPSAGNYAEFDWFEISQP